MTDITFIDITPSYYIFYYLFQNGKKISFVGSKLEQ